MMQVCGLSLEMLENILIGQCFIVISQRNNHSNGNVTVPLCRYSCGVGFPVLIELELRVFGVNGFFFIVTTKTSNFVLASTVAKQTKLERL